VIYNWPTRKIFARWKEGGEGWENERPFLPLSPVYTQHCAERENSYTHAYIATCLNAKVISPVTCRSSVKYLMNSRPVEAFLSALSRGRTRRSLPFFFFTTSLIPLPPALPRRFRPSIKAIWNVCAAKDIENGKKYNKKKKIHGETAVQKIQTKEPHGIGSSSKFESGTW